MNISDIVEPQKRVNLSVPEASKFLGVSLSTIDRLCLSGKLVKVKHGSRAFVNFKSLIRYAENPEWDNPCQEACYEHA